MKQFFLSGILLVFLSVSQLMAQEITVTPGLKIGANIGSPIGPMPEGATGSPGIGHNTGFFLQILLNENLGFQVEFAYSVKGSSFQSPVSGDTTYAQVLAGQTYYLPTTFRGTVEGSFRNHYFEFPLVAYWKFSERWSLQGGPYLAFLMLAGNSGTADIEVGNPDNPYTSVTDEPFDESGNINAVDYGMVLGPTYEMDNGLSLGVRLSGSFKSLYKAPAALLDGTIRNYYLQVQLGFLFGE